MIFQRIQTEGIAQLSYIVGDDSSGTAAVIDPRPNVDVYLELARRFGVAITHVFETHIHADFMSGARELADRLGAAKIYASGEENAQYDFPVQRIHGGDRFEFGSVVLTARHTPGHTPEHLSYELAETGREQQPWGVLSGDSLFVGSAGRPDLLGDQETERLTHQLFDTLREYYLKLDDGVIVYPCHGAGSACGAEIGERPMTTIGYERHSNAFLQQDDFDAFEQLVQKDVPPVPHHYPIMKQVNAKGPKLIGAAPVVPPLSPEAFDTRMRQGDVQLVDTRHMLAFGGGHIPGAINIGDRPELSVWAGDMLSYEKPILLVIEDDGQVDWIAWQFAYVGLIEFAGYLAGGMKSWENRGMPMVTLPQLPVQQLAEQESGMQVLDVRSDSEFAGGRIAGAKHKFVAEMRDGVNGELGLNKESPVAVYCGSGYRASIAASLMQRAGFSDVRNVPGSMKAWRSAGFQVEK
jgi:hydroxyacylglutathione hydrolase